jgi:hypothetical protein
MVKTISEEINAWWNNLDLIDKILIKDAISCFSEYGIYSNNEGEENKEKYINAIYEKFKEKDNIGGYDIIP